MNARSLRQEVMFGLGGTYILFVMI